MIKCTIDSNAIWIRKFSKPENVKIVWLIKMATESVCNLKLRLSLIHKVMYNYYLLLQLLEHSNKIVYYKQLEKVALDSTDTSTAEN